MDAHGGDHRGAKDRPGDSASTPGEICPVKDPDHSRQTRQRSAGRRVAAANARDAAADARDAAAAARDIAADLRDRKWAAHDRTMVGDGHAATGAEVLMRAAQYRKSAAADRAAAADARATAASERSRAAIDREQAAGDRARAQLDRAALLRQLASAERHEIDTQPAVEVLAACENTAGVADGFRELFWRVFNTSQNPMMLLDQDRRIVAVNRAHIAALGYSRDEMLGLRLDTFCDEGEWEFLEANWRTFQRQGIFSGDRTMVHADGARLRVQYAAHWAHVAGRSIALYVALSTSAHPSAIRTLNLKTGDSLSARELEVLGWVAMGRRAHEIATELGIASTTVESHVRSAMRKVGARSQAQLVAVACAYGLLDLEAVSAKP